jgi:uracil-DNA glycosylase family 4|tara:strand:+ start:215 stop:925 length:711 start_codon:yes stop_codon:yes gene_type:complete
MNQSNKKNLEFIVNSGVNYFLQDSPRNWFENEKKSELSNPNINTGDKKMKIDDVIKDLKDHKSNLQKTAKNLVVYDGNLNAKVMLIGEAPGRDEDQQGIPFVGRAGQLLNKMLLAINLQREDVYITNVVNWRPPDNRTPNDEEILEFLPFLQRQIDIIKPKFIFLLGGVAAKAILSTPLALGKLRGKWHEYKSLNLDESIPTIASYHPAFLLRSPQYKKHSWEDLQMLQEKLKNVS